ncbi:sequence-specific DNA binding [Musa troglodytarum]|uniref:Sequence-specific DNA binding n=1 Tax=Musa troglodytarum TaxID=320322 RepID=A0A9E7L8K4_9LILI|nr:sequence-specific DNA binding [Musa troglodytarum]
MQCRSKSSWDQLRSAKLHTRHDASMEEGECNTSLSLAVGGGKQFTPSTSRHVLFPHHPEEEEEEEEDTKRHVGSVSRWTELDEEEEEEEEGVSGKDDSGNLSDDKPVGARKKLKLTIKQVRLLEESFRERSTLTTTQKQALAHRLNIRPRQVEVWFQNRRARTKLKRIELDYECLRVHCDRLSDENWRLKRELQELRSAPPASPFYVHLLKASTLTVCPACERIAAAGKRQSSASEGGMQRPQLVPVNTTGLLRLQN